MTSSVQYYKNDFPADSVWKFFTARSPERPENREFSNEFCIGNESGWKRYISCKNSNDLRAIVVNKSFQALHIGPCFSDAATRARVPNVKIVGKELVFDLDLQDIAWFGVDKTDQASNDRYVRAVFASTAVLVEILREVMGFEHFVAVYSGRRGVHLWVLDKRAFCWGDAERGALCKFIAGVPSKRDNRVIETFHILNNPSFGETVWKAVEKARNVLLAPKNAGGVGLFDKQRDVDSFLTALFDVPVEDKFKEYKARMEKEARCQSNMKTGWEAYEKIKAVLASNKFYVNRFRDIFISLTWPIIDVGATAKTNHCTKSVFSLHAKTGRVAVPVLLDQLYSSKDNPLPPIVDPAEIKVDFTSSMHHFTTGIKLINEAMRVLTPKTKNLQDIEDLVSNVSKRPRV